MPRLPPASSAPSARAPAAAPPSGDGAAPRRAFFALLPARAQFTSLLDTLWPQIERTFAEPALGQWLGFCRELAAGAGDAGVMLAYLRVASRLGTRAGIEPLGILARMAVELARDARHGARAAEVLIQTAPLALRCLRDGAGFAGWLRTVGHVAREAPESFLPLLARTERLLGSLDDESFDAWALSGIRAAGGDPERRRIFFHLDDPSARRLLAQGGAVPFSLLERRLKVFFPALWGQAPLIRPAGGTAGKGSAEPPRRVSFDDGFIRVPEAFPGMPEGRVLPLYRAALAHVAAHLRFGRGRFPVGSLKPLQVALVSLIEDARVEQLAMEALPGLKRLWLPWHVAEGSGAATAPALLARLARALIDPEFIDDHAWIAKGRAMFRDAGGRIEDPAISREIGGLLGNDLGQMRVQFNAKSHVVEPPYRDDNLGLWNFGEPKEGGEEAEAVEIAARPVPQEQPKAEPERKEPESDDAEADQPLRVRVSEAEEVGFPVATYPEWDHLIGRSRADWTTIVEFAGVAGAAEGGVAIDRLLERNAGLIARIEGLIRSAKVSRPARLRRQVEGETLDLDACIAAEISRRLGETPDRGLYSTMVRRHRDLTSLVLLDASHSTNDPVPGSGESVLTLERAAVALIAHAMAGLGDRFALRAFCSDGRTAVNYYRIKDFPAPYNRAAQGRLGALQGRLSTRIGAALRHAGTELGAERSHRRLLLIVTDGEPSDIDVADRRYLVEDARHAVLELGHKGIDVFCVGLDPEGDRYLTRIFGRRNVLQIDRIERLPEKLPMLYLRLTA